MHLHIIAPINPNQFIKSDIASYRLRLSYVYNAAIELGFLVTGGLEVPDNANIYYIGKITKEMDKKFFFNIINKISKNKSLVLTDYTDDWLSISESKNKEIYSELIKIDSKIIVPVFGLAKQLHKRGINAFVIPDGIDNIPNNKPSPKNNKTKNVLWHGHSSNIKSVLRILEKDLVDYNFNLHLVSSSFAFNIIKNTKFLKKPKCKLIAHLWDIKKLQDVSKKCDFAILPTDKNWASANRLVTTFRLGLPIIAETISSYSEYSNFYSKFNKSEIKNMFYSPEKWYKSVELAQLKIEKDFNFLRLINLWKEILKI